MEIERRLKQVCDIPICHDDQHGTAIVVASALLNACRLTEKPVNTLRVVINGAGAAALAVARLLLSLGVPDLIVCDRFGLLYNGNPDMTAEQADVCRMSNPRDVRGTLTDAIKDADVFIGLSAPN